MKNFTQKTKDYFAKNKIKIIGILILTLFVTGVSFVQILDKTKKKRTRRIEYIVVHYTANLNPGANARMNAKYLQRKEGAGTHYCIDDQEIIQCTQEENVAYAIGDRFWAGFVPKRWFLTDNGSRKILNNNSLNFEMCLGGGRNDSLIIETTAANIGWQLVNKGLDLSRVVRHHDVTGKHCPKFIYNQSWNQKKEDGQWWKFRQRVKFYQDIHLKAKEERRLRQANAN